MRMNLLLAVFFFLTSHSFSQTDSVLKLFFDVNKYQLRKDHLAQLGELINKGVSITCIKGFADSTGSTKYNKALSQQRAKAVYVYLSNQHFIDSKTEVRSYGEQQAANEDISYNRRVEICYNGHVSREPTTEEKTNMNRENVIEGEKVTDSPTRRYELKNIYFVPDKAIIEAWSFNAVDDAAKYLKSFPGCRFEIVGHVNYVLSPAALSNPKALEPAQKLSADRARTVYDLLIEREIAATNMTYKGVGNSQMVFKDPKNDEEKRKNMRVEILIYCDK
jgi:outer membrane protein OmpA-like peptidoglycan-associated protein